MTILLIPHIWVISCRANGQMVFLSTWSIFTRSNIISVSGKMPAGPRSYLPTAPPNLNDL